MIRSSQARGFYPPKLDKFLETLFDKVDTPHSFKHGISPHAGIVFSGLASAALYKSLKKSKTIIILGNDHYGNAFEISSHPYDAWETPLGKVPVNQEIIEKLGLPLVESIKEHSIEVQLPFLQHLWGDFSIVPITVPRSEISQLEELGQKLKLLKVPIIATTDFSHYVPKVLALEKDKLAIDKILEGDAREFKRVVVEQRITMCGVNPVGAWLFATEGLDKELLLYYTSGDIVGDENEVVGYGAIGGGRC